MTGYEELLNYTTKEDITVIENYDFSGTKIKGLYCDNTVALDNRIETQYEKCCILAEEIGHYHTTTGNILNQSDICNRKQERKARAWAYNKMVGLYGIISAYQKGCNNLNETAEYLQVTEDFLSEAISYYKSKYGIHTTVDNYVIYFEPSIGVFELI